MNSTTSPETGLELATHILAGLLASGHYTEVVTTQVGEDDYPEVRQFDLGEGWKADGLRSRYKSHCVGRAVELLDELRAELADDAASKTRVGSIPVEAPQQTL